MSEHLFDCPHCRKPTISAWEKGFASASNPVRCSNCNEPAYVSVGCNLSLKGLLELILLLCVLLAFVRYYYAAAALLVAGGALGLYLGRRLPLLKTDKTTAARAKQRFRLFAFCALAVLLGLQHFLVP